MGISIFLRAFSTITVLILILGCVSVDYMGKSYSTTTHVDIYFDEVNVPRSYTTMGEVTARCEGGWCSSDEFLEELRTEAMTRGADAILILGKNRIEIGSTTTTNTKGEVEKKGEFEAREHSMTNKTFEDVVRAKFLKYQFE